MEKPSESDLRELISSIDRANQTGKDLGVAIGEQLRGELISEIEACLIDMDRLKSYMGMLQATLASKPRYANLLAREDLSKVLQHGLSVLNDEALVRLALNPIALWQLYDQLLHSESTEDYWVGLMCEAELAARGLPPWSEWENVIDSMEDPPMVTVSSSDPHSDKSDSSAPVAP